MRHLKAGRRLGRNAEHRLALMRNLTMALIQHGRIITTLAKAKEVRPFVEKLITLAKKGTLHARRLAMARLGPMGAARPKAFAEKEADRDTRKVLRILFEEIGPRFRDRPGGYTRIVKRPQRRLGDAGKTALLELLREGEKKVRTKAPAPVPRVAETPPMVPPPPAPETPPTPSAETPPPTPEVPSPATVTPTPPPAVEGPSPAPEGSPQPPASPEGTLPPNPPTP
jgi:large subunit ribosomal protein L17